MQHDDLNTHHINVGSSMHPGTEEKPSLSFGDGDTGFYENADDTIILTRNGNDTFQMGHYFGSMFTDGSSLIRAGVSGTVPGLLPKSGDTNTGIGSVASDNVSLICGGLEAIRAEDPGDLAATETSLWLYDNDNGTIQQVTVGAANSGGAGFKVLRIPN